MLVGFFFVAEGCSTAVYGEFFMLPPAGWDSLVGANGRAHIFRNKAVLLHRHFDRSAVEWRNLPAVLFYCWLPHLWRVPRFFAFGSE